MNNNQNQPSARTDDLLASGADSKDGAKGFVNKSDAAPLQTGMEGIAEATGSQGNQQSDSQDQNVHKQTLTENPGQMRNKQGS